MQLLIMSTEVLIIFAKAIVDDVSAIIDNLQIRPNRARAAFAAVDQVRDGRGEQRDPVHQLLALRK